MGLKGPDPLRALAADRLDAELILERHACAKGRRRVRAVDEMSMLVGPTHEALD